MSESHAIPLADVVKALAGELEESCAVIDFAAHRCDSHDAQHQYVKPGQVERWQQKTVRELALDTVEEIGDAVAYLAAIVHREPERAAEWMPAVMHLSWVFDSVARLGWEDTSGN